MKETTVTVKFKEGLHARPAVKLIKTASTLESAITLEKRGKVVPADSITAVLGACIICGDEITVRAEGADEDHAIEVMEAYFA